MNRPLISAIIIFLDEEKFLQEAIESVFAQTYDSWELLLVDDGSTDRSTEIAQHYAEQHPGKVCYLEHLGHQNLGMSASRNLGIRHAQGEYIAFLDADDVWLPRKLEQQLAILEAQPKAGMLCSATQYWYSWTENPEDSQRDVIIRVGAPQDTLVQPPALLTLLYPLGEGAAPCAGGLLMRRNVVEEVGGYETMFRGMYEDQAFLTKVYLRTPVYVASACWDRYRQHPDSCLSVATNMGQYHSIRQFFLNWLENYLSEQNAKNTVPWQVLQKRLRQYRYPVSYQLQKRIQYVVKLMKTQSRKFTKQVLRVPSSR